MHELLREYVQGFQLPGLKDQAFGSWKYKPLDLTFFLLDWQLLVKQDMRQLPIKRKLTEDYKGFGIFPEHVSQGLSFRELLR